VLVSAPAASPIPDGLLLRIYRVVLLTRALDHQMWLLSRQGRAGFVLTARGHEVAQVASAAAMRRGRDSAWPYYRDMGVGLALGVTPYEILLGALARGSDPHSGGRQLPMHLSSRSLRIGSISSAIAAQIPQAVGAAYAARVRGEDSVALTWFGDGAASEGATHEAMNLAAVHRLPVVFLCENNGLAISVPLAQQMPIERVADRGAAYAMPGVCVDGTDAEAVYAASRDAMERARRGDGPTLLELRVPRITPHSSQDDDAYRDDAQRAAAAAADPLPRLRKTVFERGLLGEADDAALVRALREQVIADEDLALTQPEPDPERARRWLYAGDAAHDSADIPERYTGWTGVFDD